MLRCLAGLALVMTIAESAVAGPVPQGKGPVVRAAERQFRAPVAADLIGSWGVVDAKGGPSQTFGSRSCPGWPIRDEGTPSKATTGMPETVTLPRGASAQAAGQMALLTDKDGSIRFLRRNWMGSWAPGPPKWSDDSLVREAGVEPGGATLKFKVGDAQHAMKFSTVLTALFTAQGRRLSPPMTGAEIIEPAFFIFEHRFPDGKGGTQVEHVVRCID